jgi:hypothetical protein
MISFTGGNPQKSFILNSREIINNLTNKKLLTEPFDQTTDRILRSSLGTIKILVKKK